MDTTISMIYQVFALLAGLVVASFLCVLFMRRRRYSGLVVHSRLPRYASVGEDFDYTVSIRNSSTRLFPAATLFENPEDPRPSPAEFVSLMEGTASSGKSGGPVLLI